MSVEFKMILKKMEELNDSYKQIQEKTASLTEAIESWKYAELERENKELQHRLELLKNGR